MEVSFSDRQDMALTGSFSVMDSSTNHFTVIRLPLYSWDANVEGSMGRLLDIGEQGKQDAMSLPSSEREWAPPPSSYSSHSHYQEEPQEQEHDAEEEDSSSDDNANNPRPIQFPCQQCRQIKTKCNRMMPCTRCVRLGLECREQDCRKPVGRPRTRPRPLTAPARKRAKSGPPTQPQPSNHEAEALCRRPAKDSESSSSASGSDDGSTDGSTDGSITTSMTRLCGSDAIIDSLLSKAANYQIKAFLSMKARGKVDEELAACYVRQWTKYKDQHKDDISLGLSDVIAYALERRLGGLCNTSLINRDPNFNPKEEGSLIADGSLPRFIQKLQRDRACAVVGEVYHQGRFRIFCNDRFSTSFVSADEMKERMKRFGAAPTLLWSSVIHPDDIQSFYTKLTDHQLSPPQRHKEMGIICKCIDRHGVVAVSLLRIRSMVLLGGDYSACILSIFCLPISRDVYPFPSSSSPTSLAADAHQPPPPSILSRQSTYSI